MADACFDCLCAFQGIITAQIVPLDWIAPFAEQRLRYQGLPLEGIAVVAVDKFV